MSFWNGRVYNFHVISILALLAWLLYGVCFFILNTECCWNYLLPRKSSASLPHVFRVSSAMLGISTSMQIHENHEWIHEWFVIPSHWEIPLWAWALQTRFWPWISSAFASAGLPRIIHQLSLFFPSILGETLDEACGYFSIVNNRMNS